MLTGLNIIEFDKLAHQFGKYFQIEKATGRPHHLSNSAHGLFFILFYMRHYCTQELTSLFFHIDQSQVSRWIPIITTALNRCSNFYLLKHNYRKTVKLCFNEIHFLVDATERQVHRPKINNQRIYSGKKKLHTGKNQILLDNQNYIAHVSPTYTGKTHDIKVFRFQKYPKHYNFLGDLGYIGENNIKTPIKNHKKLTVDEKYYNTVFRTVRTPIEHTFAWLKHYRILSDTFRGSKELFLTSFPILCGLYNFALEIRSK